MLLPIAGGGGGIQDFHAAFCLVPSELGNLGCSPWTGGKMAGGGGRDVHLSVLCRALSLVLQHWSCFSYRSLPPFPSVS